MPFQTGRKHTGLLALLLALVLSLSALAPSAAAASADADSGKTIVAYGEVKYPSLTDVGYDTYRRLDYGPNANGKYTYFYDFRDTWYAGCDNADAPTRPSFAGRRTKLLSDQQGFWGIRASTEEDALTYEVYTYLDHVTVSGIEFRTYDDAECIVLDDTPNETFTRTTTNLENGPYTLCVWFDYTHGDGTVETVGIWQTLYVSDGHGWFADCGYAKDDQAMENWLAKKRNDLAADDAFQDWVEREGGNDLKKAVDVTAIHYPFKSNTSRYPDDSSKWRKLAHEICPDEEANDYIKARALFGWMQSNIAYDWDYLANNTENVRYRWEDAAAAKTARGFTMWDSHLGMCEDFSNAYAIMCRELGIPCHNMCNKTHAWNIVYLNGRWEIVDVNTGLRDACVGTDNKAYAANVEAYWAEQDPDRQPVWGGFCVPASSKLGINKWDGDKYSTIEDKMKGELDPLNIALYDANYFILWRGTIRAH